MNRESQIEVRRIQRLSPLVAEKIAAGEVIERPASVVKELLENSIDAGATEIAVVLEDGGKSLIEIIDNGHGIMPEDLPLTIERHATSKIREMEDLETLVTLGFRGEALASVAAVSDLSILSRPKVSSGAPAEAHEFRVENQVPDSRPKPVTHGHFLGSPHGTRIRVQGLFAQIPARLKFLKAQSSEVAQVRDWMERLALSHPGISFRLVSNDRTLMNLRANDESSRIQAVLSDGEDLPLLSVSNENDPSAPIKVRVHWLQGFSSPQTRKIIQIVNRRAVRDRLLQQALLNPFRQALLPGRFPAVAMLLEIDPSRMDVNVHPTKTELRFLESSKIFHAIESLVQSMIQTHGAPGFAAGKPQTWSHSLPATEPSTGVGTASRSEDDVWSGTPSPAPQGEAPQGGAGSVFPTGGPSYTPSHSTHLRASDPALQNGWNFSSVPVLPLDPETAPATTDNTQASRKVDHPFRPERFVGILFNTYLLYDFGSELGLIDQHAAHERIRYEKLRKRLSNASAASQRQALLIPEVVQVNPELAPTLEERLPLLDNMGFEAEVFGEGSLVFRAVPGEWGTDSLRIRLKSLVDRLLALETDGSGAQSAGIHMDETIFESLASEACHSAVRAGDRLDKEEALALTEQLFRCEHPWNCPHGRPTVVRTPQARLEEWFQRRV